MSFERSYKGRYSPVSYAGKRMALLTRHGKEQVMAPLLEDTLGCQVEHVQGYDADLLGTFTRGVPHADTQLATARTKARIGMGLLGLTLGLASEGSFGPDPFAWLMPWNIEIVLLIDTEAELEILGEAQGPGNHQQLLAASWGEAEQFARVIGFPRQFFILRPENPGDRRIQKDLSSWDALEQAYRNAEDQADSGKVFIETDGRAHGNPMRMEMIGKATTDLLQKIQSLCPSCGAPGFSVIHHIPGLPCRRCGSPTKVIQAVVQGCQRCETRKTIPATEHEYADPGWCGICNP